MNDLVKNIDKLHTTDTGRKRIERNLGLTGACAVEQCRMKIMDKGAVFEKKGKNWYVRSCGCVITVNAGSFTIITAHMEKNNAVRQRVS